MIKKRGPVITSTSRLFPTIALVFCSSFAQSPLFNEAVCGQILESKKVFSRSSMHFHKDPSIYHHHQSSLKDYSKSGYDRGHMVPAADQQSSREALEKTFLLSNICPQTASLNRGLWAKLEQKTRAMVGNNREVEVITGPLFLSSPEGNKRFVKYQVIGQNEVAVPTHFFKLINSKNQKIAYIIPNQNIDPGERLEQFQVPISTLEKSSGLHFHFK